MKKIGRPPPAWFAELAALPRKDFYSTPELAARFLKAERTINGTLSRHGLKPEKRPAGENLLRNYWHYEDLLSLANAVKERRSEELC